MPMRGASHTICPELVSGGECPDKYRDQGILPILGTGYMTIKKTIIDR